MQIDTVVVVISGGTTSSSCPKIHTTAEYYIFLTLNTLQLNPEISTICWRTPLDAEDEMSLYRYFKSVIRL